MLDGMNRIPSKHRLTKYLTNNLQYNGSINSTSVNWLHIEKATKNQIIGWHHGLSLMGPDAQNDIWRHRTLWFPSGYFEDDNRGANEEKTSISFDTHRRFSKVDMFCHGYQNWFAVKRGFDQLEIIHTCIMVGKHTERDMNQKWIYSNLFRLSL